MNQWGWALATAILVITLVQLVVFYYLMRDQGDQSLWPSSASEGPDSSPPRRIATQEADAGGEGPDESEDVQRCSRCGAPNRNESMFTFCRNCGGEL